MRAASNLTRVLLPKDTYEGGRCMDGSQAGYFYGPPSSGASDLWVVFLEGGGSCQTKATCELWSRGRRGGSATWPETLPENVTRRICSPDPSKNPEFHDAHHVCVPYCTGDLHLGQISSPTSTQWNYYFDGHLNVKALAQHILGTHKAAARMKNMIFHGTSAGGKGVLHNCDFLQHYLAEMGSSAKVACVPEAAWFMPGMTEDNPDPEAPPTMFERWSQGRRSPPQEAPDPLRNWSDVLPVWRPYLPEDCTAAHTAEPDKCLSTHVLYPYIKAPVYAVQDMFDSYSILAVLGMPRSQEGTEIGHRYLAYFGRAMRKSTNLIKEHPWSKQGDGLFLTSCYSHGNTAMLAGVDKFGGLADWFFGRGHLPKVLVDNCTMQDPGLPCNRNCVGAGFVDACIHQMMASCGGSLGTEQECLTCAAAGPEIFATLQVAGCTHNLVRAFCSARASPDGDCADRVRVLCKGSLGTSEECRRCAERHRDALRELGCRPKLVRASCAEPAQDGLSGVPAGQQPAVPRAGQDPAERGPAPGRAQAQAVFANTAQTTRHLPWFAFLALVLRS